MMRSLRVVMLLTDGYGGRGGIAKFNRDFLNALDSCVLVHRVNALPRVIPESIQEAIPEAIIYDRKAARGRLAFLYRLALQTYREMRIDLVVCGHLHLLPAAWLVARLRRARLALIIHGIESWVPSPRFLARLLADKVDAVIAVSYYSAERFTQWSKVPIEQCFILPNCVDLETFLPQSRDPNLLERYNFKSNRIILTVARLSSQERYKGIDQMIELMPRLLKQFPDLKYLIVGQGDDRPRLEVKAIDCGVADYVIFAGQIPEFEKVAHYNLADAYVMPSTGEGFGIALIEAAACGVPVIGSRVDGSSETLRDGLLGCLVDPSDRDEVVEALTVILSNQRSRNRSDAIDVFSVQNFRARVADWCQTQAACAAG